MARTPCILLLMPLRPIGDHGVAQQVHNHFAYLPLCHAMAPRLPHAAAEAALVLLAAAEFLHSKIQPCHVDNNFLLGLVRSVSFSLVFYMMV